MYTYARAYIYTYYNKTSRVTKAPTPSPITMWGNVPARGLHVRNIHIIYTYFAVIHVYKRVCSATSGQRVNVFQKKKKTRTLTRITLTAEAKKIDSHNFVV